jgi:hypothetical protein
VLSRVHVDPESFEAVRQRELTELRRREAAYRAGRTPVPLAGRTVVVTRAAAQAQRFTELLRASGARVIEAPAIVIGPPPSWEPLETALGGVESFTWVVFTSTNGVLMVDRRLAALGLAWTALSACRVAAIGPATADALREHGVRVDVVPAEYRAEGLVSRLAPLLAAAAAARGAAPVALLAHPRLAAGPDGRSVLQDLAAALGATGESGLVGAPLLGANGRGAQELAPSVVTGDARQALAGASGLLLIGDEAWAELDTGSARVVLATSQPTADDPRVSVILPLAHPYERQGSLTNLEGRVQKLEPSGFAAPTTLPDWTVLARLANALGATAPTDLPAIRAALAQQHPSYALVLTGSPSSHGQLLESAGAA